MASIAASRRSYRSFQRITTIGSIAAVEQRRHGFAGDPVAFVLEPVDLDRVVRDVPEPAQARDRLGDLAGGGVEHAGQLDRLVHRRLDLVQAEVVGDLLGVVDDVVERRGEREDVLAVDRRHERVVEPIDDVVRDPVALVLAVEDLRGKLLAVREVDSIRSSRSAACRMFCPASSNNSK